MNLQQQLQNKKILLASGSPRRQQLLGGLDIDFEIVKQDVDESWPPELKGGDIAEFLALKKSNAFDKLGENEILITADTIVWHQDTIMNKPVDTDDAKSMLKKLSADEHKVFTGVCIRSLEKCVSFYDTTSVDFKKLLDEEIEYYITNYNPFDKAGSYGAQDWLGYVAIEKLEGCYYNVMGFPMRKIYSTLLTF
ncbi:MAG: septum formation protein [Patiriisocius sp.]|jgi:septum formation protein